MATGHALSMVTNSSVKLPINPKTKLACTFPEREDEYASSGDEIFSRTWPQRPDDGYQNGHYADDEHDDEAIHTGLNGTAGPNSIMRDDTGNIFTTLTRDLAHLSDDQFYDKLLELKNEHRKTLNSLESAYNRSRQNSPRNPHEHDEGIETYSHLNKTGPFHDHGKHVIKQRNIDDRLDQFNQSMPSWSALKKDNVRDMSAKPPSGRPRSAWSDRKKRPGSAVSQSLRASRERDDWKDITWTSGTSDSECESSNVSAQNTTRSSMSNTAKAFADSPVAVVENMWDNFSVEDYAPRSRSGSESRASVRSNRSIASSKKSQEWSPKITVPKPFTMTVRDAGKTEKTKSRAVIELEKELEEKQKAEEAECQKQFKATPAPATTYLPLYDELQEKQAEKSRQNQEMSKELSKSIQKPFKFFQREEEKKRHKSRSLPLATPESKTKAKKQFKARPVPKSVHDPNVAERILEEEEYRKIRIRMRAEEMLHSAALPPNMNVKGKEYTDGKQRQKRQKSREKMAFLTNEHKFHPQVKGEVPDYDELYRKFQNEASRKVKTKEPTVVQPFNLRTARIPSKKDRIIEEMRAEEEQRKLEARSGLSLSKSGSSLRRSLSASADIIPTKTTTAAQLRKSVTELSIKKKAEKEREAIERERQQRQKVRKMQSMIANKALANDKSETLSMTSQEKMRQYRQAERSRQEEYDQELREIQTRVESRPFLFERESQTSAKKKAERKYQQALRDAGIDEDFLVRKSRGARPASGRSSRNSVSYGDDDFEKSDSIGGGLNSVRSGRSGSVRRSVYSDDESISSIHTEED